MKVRCIANTGEYLPSANIDPRRGLDRSTEFPLTIGRTYVVFALTIFLGTAWYYVIDDDDLAWPIWRPSSLFEISDGTIPASWIIGDFGNSGEDQRPILSFPEWATDRRFYEHLVDDQPEAVAVFERRRLELES